MVKFNWNKRGCFKWDKKLLYTVVCVCMAFVLLCSAVIGGIVLFSSRNDKIKAPDFDEIRGTWIASVYNLNFPSRADLTENEIEGELDEIVKTAKEAGLNTVFFQVRPSSDALYKSDIFPVSRYLSSTGEMTADPLEYIIEAAHREGISVHAWINPLRVAVSGSLDDLDEENPARIHPEWCVKYADGKFYYDCGNPSVRELVADGVREIIRNYDVDGIVFDDYFYPYPVYDENGEISPFDDGDTYEKYGEDFDTVEDFRRESVNSLVRLVYDTVKEENGECLFGVSPFGIWKNGYGGDEGSKTAGSQSYYDIYCDSVAWIQGSYIDYIAPQLYWRENEKAAPYTALCDWWANTTEDTGVGLVICHGAYRYAEWESPQGTLTEQVQYADQKSSYKGSLYYGYRQIAENTCGIREEIKSLYEKPLTEN